MDDAGKGGFVRSARKGSDKPTFIEEARRRQIIYAARQVILQTGFEKSTIQQIADAIGVSKGVILYHFGSKSGLGKAVLDETLASYGEHITKELSGFATPAEKILAFPHICAVYFESRQDEFTLYLDALGSFGEVDEKRSYMARANAIQRDYLMRLINAARRDGAFRSVGVQALADTIQAFVDGIVSQYCADPSKVRPSSAAQTFQAMLRSIV